MISDFEGEVFMREIKKLIPKRNIKQVYYLNRVLREYLPNSIFQKRLESYLKYIPSSEINAIQKRLNYYNRLEQDTNLNKDAVQLASYKFPTNHSTYHFDFREYSRYYDNHLKCNLFKGDITHIPDIPTIVKSRPINPEGLNSVLMNLNKVRHFVFVNDFVPFEKKKNMLVWRGSSGGILYNRKRFLNMYMDNLMCNLGNVNPPPHNDHHTVKKMSINKHLSYKFVLCLEGIDVATNLKWVMSSNSIAVMPKPKYETWFMEGTLIPNHHYIEINDDYSDLEERLNYYIEHPDQAKMIIKNAHQHVHQFLNKKLEKLLSLLVLEKYFVQTGQLEQMSSMNY